MSLGDGESRRAARFEGEDTSPTTKRELNGWYAYSSAAEVYAVVGIGSFLPVTLEQLARERGVWWTDRNTPCSEAAQSVADALARLTRRDDHDGQCVVNIFGVDVTSASFALYTFSAAVFVQALTLASFSSVADYGTYRKKMLLGFGFIGSIATMLVLFIVPAVYWIASFLVIIGVTCLGCGNVLVNSFLPLLVANHPELDNVPLNRSPAAPVSDRNHNREINSTDIQLSTKISAKGIGIGYVAAVIGQILSIGVLLIVQKISSSTTLPLRLVVFLSGAAWIAGTIPTQLWLRDRPGPQLKAVNTRRNKVALCFAYIAFSWASLWKTVKTAAKLRQVVVFLIAWFLLSDATATISGTAILFARTELHMGTVAIALLSITATVSGIAGAFLWPAISRRLKLRTNHTIIGCILLSECIALYGLLGYVPFIQSWGVGGLQQSWEIFPLGVVHGFVMGGLNSYCRSFYGTLIPPGSEAAFYALYAITDKGSSAVGPAVVGKIVDLTGHIRPAFIFLSILILTPAPLIWWVDVGKGREDALRMAEMMKKSSGEEFELRASGERDEEAEGLLSDDD